MSPYDYDNAWHYPVPDELLEYTARELEQLPVITQGQADDLHVELELNRIRWRVWLCRCGISDGMPYNNMITIEGYDPSDFKWKDAVRYQG